MTNFQFRHVSICICATCQEHMQSVSRRQFGEQSAGLVATQHVVEGITQRRACVKHARKQGAISGIGSVHVTSSVLQATGTMV